MNPKILIFSLVTMLHDLFTAIWIGGMLVTLAAFLPTLQSTIKNPAIKTDLLALYQKKLSILVFVSMGGLWLTGMLLAKQSGEIHGVLTFATPSAAILSIKHILTVVLMALVFLRRLGPGRHLTNPTPSQKRLYGLLLGINCLIGIVILFLSALSSAI